MSLPSLPLVGFDIETDTTSGGLDPSASSIVAVAISVNWVAEQPRPPGSACVSGAAGPPVVEHVLTGAEAQIIADTDRILAGLPAGYLVTWNGSTFDLPFVRHRARELGLRIGLETVDDPARRFRDEPGRPAVRGRWYDLVHLDGFVLYRADVGVNLHLSCGLKPLAKLVGMTPVELDQSQLHLESDEDIAAYVASDARTAVALVLRRWPSAQRVADFRLAGVGSP